MREREVVSGSLVEREEDLAGIVEEPRWEGFDLSYSDPGSRSPGSHLGLGINEILSTGGMELPEW